MEMSAEGLVSRALSLETRRSEAQQTLETLEQRRLALEQQLEACRTEVGLAASAAVYTQLRLLLFAAGYLLLLLLLLLLCAAAGPDSCSETEAA